MVLERLNNLTYETIFKWFLKWTLIQSIICASINALFFSSWKSLVVYNLGENYKFESAEIHVLTHYPDSILWFNQSDSSQVYFRSIEDVIECRYNDKYIIATQEGTQYSQSYTKDIIVTAPKHQRDTTVYWLIDKTLDMAYGPYSDEEFHGTWDYKVKDLKLKRLD